jgi:hypothetical protein
LVLLGRAKGLQFLAGGDVLIASLLFFFYIKNENEKFKVFLKKTFARHACKLVWDGVTGIQRIA